MCIICNCPPYSSEPNTFLSAWDLSVIAMRETAAKMLAVSKIAITPEHRKRYDATHKQMLRVMHEWNKLEHFREGHAPETEGGK